MKDLIYADPSLLVSALIQDANTERALALIGSANRVIAITELVDVEIRNALELAAFRSPSAVDSVERAVERYGRMIQGGLWRMIEMDFKRCFQRARGLSRSHTRQSGCRSLDILHVAGAMELGIRRFWSLDAKQTTLARAVGMEVSP